MAFTIGKLFRSMIHNRMCIFRFNKRVITYIFVCKNTGTSPYKLIDNTT